jgi:hypothetical protein
MERFSYWYKLFNIFMACLQNMTLGGIIFGILLLSFYHSLFYFWFISAGWASISGGLLIGSKASGGAELSSDVVQVTHAACSSSI